jgi:hypothetical protein
VNRYLTLLLLGALLVAGCVLYNVQAELPETWTGPAVGITEIDIRADAGAISVRAGKDSVLSYTYTVTKSCKGTSQADAESHLADITTGDSLSGSTLYMWGKVPLPNNRSYNTKYEVAVPAASQLHIEATNGAVDLDSMAGAAVVIATNGPVTTTAHSGSISVEATNGAIDCDVAAFGIGDAAALHSANGRVTIYLPADASVAFDITTSNGKASVEGFTGVNYSTDESKHKVGIIGAGTAAVTLRSENGNVNIQAK